MENKADFGELHKLFDDNFIDYTSYVIRERAIPDVDDGLKPVQRRILQTLFNMDDGRFHKVANVVGATMKLHPHGDASIYAALVNLANKGFLIDRQGNFGNILTGDGASAARYIECRLSPLALATMFNKDLTTYVDSYDGRMQEPVSLPAKIPLLLLHGADGIAVGMATKILPYNFCELLEAQKKILRDEPFELFPDFPKGGLMDVSGYDDGSGRIKCRAVIVEKDEKTVTINAIPHSTTTESLIESIERAAKAGRIKIMSINDYTAEEVEIEIKLPRGIYAEDTIKALYAFSDCEIPVTPNMTVIHHNTPEVIRVSDLLRHNTTKLKADLEQELHIELGRLREKLHAHTLEQIFIEERIYKQIEECITYEAVVMTVGEGLAPFRPQLQRDVTKEDIERLLEIRIKRISRYDIDKKRREIKEINTAIRKVNKDLQDMVGFTVSYLDGLLNKYGALYPRRTKIETFHEVEIRKVALSNLVVAYDRKEGFLGSGVKSEAEISFNCSEYDKILLIFANGLYKVINVVEKLFVGSELAWVGIVEPKLLFNMIYVDGQQNLTYVKRFQMPKFILEKEYRLFAEHPRSKIMFLELGEGGAMRAYLAPSKRSRSNIIDFNFADFRVKGSSAIGKRLSERTVRRVAQQIEKAAPPEKAVLPLPGLFEPPPAKEE